MMRLIKSFLGVAMSLVLSCGGAFASPAATASTGTVKGVTTPGQTVTLDQLTGVPPAKAQASSKVTTASTSTAKMMSAMAAAPMAAAAPASTDPRPQNLAQNVTVDPTSGAAAISIPLNIPSGRRGVGPSLTLGYSPTQGNGPFGWGWGLRFGEITRSLKKGVPQFNDTTDIFLADLGSGPAELVPIGNGEYRARVEGDFVKFTFQNGSWTARTKNGMIFCFGQRTGSKVLSGTKVSKWRLDTVGDLFGNFYMIDYRIDGSFEARYVDKLKPVTSTPDPSKPENFVYVIRSIIETADRPDIASSYQQGFKTEERRRVKAIEVYGNGTLMCRYEFTYATSHSTGRSLLTTVNDVAADGQTTKTLFNIRYNDAQPVNYSLQSITTPVQGDNLWNCQIGGGYDRGHDNYGPVPAFDLDMGPVYTSSSGGVGGVKWSTNTSGRLTLSSGQDTAIQCWTYVYSQQPKTIPLNGTSGGEWGIYVNGATTTDRNTLALSSGYNLVLMTDYHQHESFSFDLGFNLADQVDLMNSSQVIIPNLSADFNGDGRADMATFFPSSGTVKVALSNGSNFLPKTTWIEGFAVNSRLILGDFNGDGRTDIASYDAATGTLRVALSDGSKFVDGGTWLTGFGSNEELTTGDFNGDGYTDLLLKKTATALTVQVAINNRSGKFTVDPAKTLSAGDSSYSIMTGDFNGDGLSDIYAFKRSTGDWQVFINPDGRGVGTERYAVSGFGTDRNPLLADYNGDGLTDIGYYDWPSGTVVTRPAKYQGFADQANLPLTFSLKDVNAQAQVADYNSDGLADIAVYTSVTDGRVEIGYSSGESRDLLISMDNARGGQSDIKYGRSSFYPNKYLPFSLPVVNELAISNAQGDVYWTRYAYRGGYWDASEREFFGFEQATITDGSGAYQKITYDQRSVYFRGRVLDSSLYGSQGQLLENTSSLWAQSDMTGLPIASPVPIKFVYLSRADRFIYDTPSSGLRTAAEYSYNCLPGFFSLREIRDLGEVDFASGKDIGNDTIIRSVSSIYNSVAWLVDYPTQIIVKDAAGNVLGQEKYFYDGSNTLGSGLANGLLTRKDIWNLNGNHVEEWPSTQFGYDAHGQQVSVKDPLGNITTTSFDTLAGFLPVRSVNAKGQVVSQEYYGVNESLISSGGLFGQLKSEVDVNGQKMMRTYDVWGRPLTVISPLDSAAYPSEISEYTDGTDRTVIVSRKRAETGKPATLDSYFYYDGLGRLVSTKQASGEAGKFIVSGQVGYDIRGSVRSVYPSYSSYQGFAIMESACPRAVQMTYDRDDRGRVIKTTFADGSYATAEYSSRTQAAVDQNGHKTRSLFNARGNLVTREEYAGADGRSSLYPNQAFTLYATTTYGYDQLGHLLSVTDAKGNVTSMTYDALGRKVAMNDPDIHNVSYQYDVLGQLTKQTDAKNVPFAFTYDVLGRPLTKARADNSTDMVTYTYDTAPNYGKGRLAQAAYSSGSASFNYDAVGEDIFSSKVFGSTTYNVTRTYDALGRTKTIAYPDGKSTAVYSYDIAGHLNSIQLQVTGVAAQNIITNIDYTVNGSIQKINYGNGAVAAYVYDPITFRPQTLVVTDKNSVAVQYNAYTYDPLGNIIRVEDKVKNTTKSFTFDALNRMSTSNAGSGVISYQYDQVGNITQNGALTYTYAEQGAGPHAVTSISDGSTMTYDANGNMASYRTAANTQYYTYDSTNRLIKVEAVDAGTIARYTVATYAYDGDGGRTQKTAYIKSGTTTTTVTTNYVGDLYDETNGLKTNYIFLGSARAAAYDGSRLRWFIGDHLGSTSVVLDEASAVTERIDYTPWGEVKSCNKYGTGPEVAWFYFTGKHLDDESGLYFFGARYYNPKLGRFITPDTVVQSPYNPQTLNRYAYCNNNPVNLVDPTGHSWRNFWKSACPVVAAAVGVVVGMFNPVLGVLAYSAIAASGQSGNYLKNFSVNAVSGMAGLGVGMCAGNLFSDAAQFWGGLAASSFGGAAAGASASAMMGGNVGTGALAGFVGGTIGYIGGQVWPMGAQALAGGVASEINGGDFASGAGEGALNSFGTSLGGDFAPMEKMSAQNVAEGDIVYFQPDSLSGIAISLFDGGPFSHVGTVVRGPDGSLVLASTTIDQNSGPAPPRKYSR
ncbi:MAG: VCBS repeat-containing protein, partial [Candidatus Omnitrophica bacterium]|nr:VCBS repeat-containing protein [Candidatus Omnitrophota bacterium]